VFAWYAVSLRKYAVFSGRARRREYYAFVFANVLIALAFALSELLVASVSGGSGENPITRGLVIVSCLYALGVFVPFLAVSARRLHDTGRSGWWLLGYLLPGVGVLILVWAASDSHARANRYGPSPKARFLSPATMPRRIVMAEVD
jgi:uncharacterized membrane protein YhaH (DUF805 family)